MVPRETQGGLGDCAGRSHLIKVTANPKPHPHNKVGQGPRGGAFPRRAQRPPGWTFGWAGRAPACRDAEALATPSHPGTPPRPRARPGLRRLRPRGGPAPLGRLPPGRAAEGGGGGTAGTGAGLQVAGPGRRARGRRGLRGAARARSPGTPLSWLHLLRGERAGSAALGAFRRAPAASGDAFSPLREPRARAGAPLGRGAGSHFQRPRLQRGGGLRARDPGGRRAAVTPPVDQR